MVKLLRSPHLKTAAKEENRRSQPVATGGTSRIAHPDPQVAAAGPAEYVRGRAVYLGGILFGIVRLHRHRPGLHIHWG